MKKKFLLYVSSVMCFSLSATQIGNAMQSFSYYSVPSVRPLISICSGDYISETDFQDLLQNRDFHIVDVDKHGSTEYVVILGEDIRTRNRLAKPLRITKDMYNRIQKTLPMDESLKSNAWSSPLRWLTPAPK